MSHTHVTYKKSVVKTLLKRALKYSSIWELFEEELRNIKQFLVHKNYTFKMKDDIVRKMINIYHEVNEKD